MTVYIVLAVAAVAVIALLFSVFSNGNKQKNQGSSNMAEHVTSQADYNDTSIVDFPEDETESDTSVLVGTWYKNDVSESQKSVLTVNMHMDSDSSFEFRLEIWNGTNSVSITGTAVYTDETTAEFSPKENAKLVLQYDTDRITITHTGKNSAYGIKDKYSIDGKFTKEEPKYAAEESKTSYDYDIYQSDKIVQAMTDTLSSQDYALYKDMMKNGLKSPIDYERTLDKNGKQVNVDAELDAVKYYAHLSSTGSDMIFICSEDAKFYLLFYSNDEIVYCTNDKNYSSKMPASFQAVAKAKNIKPTFR